MITNGRSVLTLVVGRNRLRGEARRGARTWCGEAAYASPTEVADLVGRLAGECDVPCGRLRVALGCPPVQLRTLPDLPPVRARDLAALVAHQGTRFFRRNGGVLVTDAVWVHQSGTAIARAAAVDEALVEAIAAGARASGLTLDTITVADETLPVNLLPAAERASQLRAARRRTRGLALTAAMVWALVAVTFVVRLRVERRTIDHELAALAAPLAAVLAARREVHDVASALAAITRADRERGRPFSALGSVTTALPDSAVLTSFAWRAGGALVVSGAARQAVAVLLRLERVPGFGTPAFQGPVVRETHGGLEWDRFTIAFSGSAP